MGRDRRVLWALTALAIAALALASCSSGDRGSGHAASTMRDRTDVVSFTYDVRDGLRTSALHVQINLTAGSMSWRFVDPNGAPRWEGRARADKKLDEERSFEPTPGIWRLELRPNGATGTYDIRWTTR